MAAKRQSFLAKIEQELPKQPEAKSAPEVNAAKSVSRLDILKTTIYIPHQAHDRLREIAFTERRKVHDLLMEGIDRVLESRGHAERTGKRETS